MNKSETFKLAHTLTRKVIKAGDNYQVTFGASLKMIFAMAKSYANTVAPMVASGFNKFTFKTNAQGRTPAMLENKDGRAYNISEIFGNGKANPAKYFLSAQGSPRSLQMTVIVLVIRAMI